MTLLSSSSLPVKQSSSPPTPQPTTPPSPFNPSPPPHPSPLPPPSPNLQLPPWLQRNTKVTVRLPSAQYFTKGTIKFHSHKIIFHHLNTNEKTNISTTQLSHILANNNILQGHKHHIQKPPVDTSTVPSTIQSINPNASPEPTMYKPLSS